MKIEKTLFGNHQGKEVYLFTLTNKRGVVLKVTNYGAIVTELHVPDRNGDLADVVLGFDNLKQYQDGHPYFGCAVGRVGNRIANAKFSLEGVDYQLAANNGNNCLHGGLVGYDKVIWEAEESATPDKAIVKFKYLSKDGEEGFPGNLQVTMVYTLNHTNEFKIEYSATTDKTTHVNLTHHGYFNLEGAGNTTIYNHKLCIFGDKYTVPNPELIPTGEIATVKGTALDFTSPHKMGERIDKVEGGYDHNYVLDNPTGVMVLAAMVEESKTGRTMEVYTTEPGVQFYSGNFLDGLVGKEGKLYNKHYGFCLETQHYPDSPNQPKFPSTILKPGETYKTTTIYKFAVK